MLSFPNDNIFVERALPMRRVIRTAECLIVLVIAAASVVGILFLMKSISSLLWSAEAAGWVQAVGSIAAILGAFFISARQSRDAIAISGQQARDAIAAIHKADELAFERRSRSVRAIAAIAQAHARTCLQLCADPSWSYAGFRWFDYLGEPLRMAQASIISIQPIELGSVDAIAAWSRLKTEVEWIQRSMARADAYADDCGASGNDPVRSDDVAMIRDHAEMIIASSDDLRSALRPATPQIPRG